MKVAETIIMQRRNPNGSQKECHRSHRIATTMRQPDPMLSMLEWLCTERMEAEVDQQLGAEKSERSGSRNGYHTVPVAWTPGWGRCISWFTKSVRAAISHFSSPSVSAVKPHSFRWFRRPLCRVSPLVKWRSWRRTLASKIYPEAKSAR